MCRVSRRRGEVLILVVWRKKEGGCVGKGSDINGTTEELGRIWKSEIHF